MFSQNPEHTVTVLTAVAFSLATVTTVGWVWNVMAHAQKNNISSLRTNGRVHLNRHWASVQSTAGRRGVRISGINVGYTMFRGSVKGTGCPLHSTVSPSLPFPCVTVCYQISTGVYCTLVILVIHMQSVFIQPVKMAALSAEAILLAAASAISNRNTSCPLSLSVVAVGCNQPSVLKILETVPKKMHKILSECRYVRIQSGSKCDCVTGRVAEMAGFIYLLTAVGLTPGGSSTVQCTFTHKQCIEQHN